MHFGANGNSLLEVGALDLDLINQCLSISFNKGALYNQREDKVMVLYIFSFSHARQHQNPL